VTLLAQCRTCTELYDNLSESEFAEYDRLHGSHNAWVYRTNLKCAQFVRWSDFYSKYREHKTHQPHPQGA
jgi:hypothetical protein